MAGDWIKMRASLLTNPRVTAICKLVESSRHVGKKLSTGFGGALREIVTRDVTRDVTVASLFRVWCAANEHTSDGVWYGIELDDLDHVAGVPGFGSMMESVGWAVVDVDNQTVTFPNFLEYNAPAKDGRSTSAAERQRRYREKQRAKSSESDVTGDVTRDVTVLRNSDVEKRREENIPVKEVLDFWNTSMNQKCEVTTKRKRSFAARWKEQKFRDNWKQAILNCSQSKFHCGGGSSGWVADFEWFLKPESLQKLLELQTSGKPRQPVLSYERDRRDDE